MTEEGLKKRVWAAMDSVVEYDTTVEDLRDAVVRDLLPMVQAAEDLADSHRKCIDELMGALHSEFDGVWSDEDFALHPKSYEAALTTYRKATGAA